MTDGSPRNLVIMLMLRTLTSWGYTVRLLLLVLALAALIFVALWSLNIDLEVGPLRINNTAQPVVT